MVLRRMKTWIGEHPVTAVTLWTAIVAAVQVSVFLFGWLGMLDPVPRVLEWPLSLAWLLGPVVAVAAGTFTVGRWLGRAGRRVARLAWALPWTVVVSLPAATIGVMVVSGESFSADMLDRFFIRFYGEWTLAVATALATYLSLGQLAGWGTSALLTAVQSRRERWEHLEPMGRGAGAPTTAAWTAKHPLEATALAAFGCAAFRYGGEVLLSLLWLKSKGAQPIIDWLWLPTGVALVGWFFCVGHATGRARRGWWWMTPAIPLGAGVFAAAAAAMTFLNGLPPAAPDTWHAIRAVVSGAAMVIGVGWIAGWVTGGLRGRNTRTGDGR